MNRHKLTNYITKIAIFAALSTVLYMVPKFPLPFLFPGFLEVQFSNLPAILGGFITGPIGGVLILVIKTIIKLFVGSHTAGVGELADLMIGVSSILTSSLIYQKNRTKKGGIIALICGVIAWVVASIIANGTFLIDFYAKFYADKGGLDMIIQVCSKVLPNINRENFMITYLLGAVLPFNLMLSVIVSIVTFLVYKRVSILFNREAKGE